ncbi:hypothetical protein SNEBB_001116 [Seison nebaliae]|nr:hypothetical protein SNEBB_001116 [Seison nebaliae]
MNENSPPTKNVFQRIVKFYLNDFRLNYVEESTIDLIQKLCHILFFYLTRNSNETNSHDRLKFIEIHLKRLVNNSMECQWLKQQIGSALNIRLDANGEIGDKSIISSIKRFTHRWDVASEKFFDFRPPQQLIDVQFGKKRSSASSLLISPSSKLKLIRISSKSECCRLISRYLMDDLMKYKYEYFYDLTDLFSNRKNEGNDCKLENKKNFKIKFDIFQSLYGNRATKSELILLYKMIIFNNYPSNQFNFCYPQHSFPSTTTMNWNNNIDIHLFVSLLFTLEIIYIFLQLLLESLGTFQMKLKERMLELNDDDTSSLLLSTDQDNRLYLRNRIIQQSESFISQLTINDNDLFHCLERLNTFSSLYHHLFPFKQHQQSSSPTFQLSSVNKLRTMLNNDEILNLKETCRRFDGHLIRNSDLSHNVTMNNIYIDTKDFLIDIDHMMLVNDNQLSLRSHLQKCILTIKYFFFDENHYLFELKILLNFYLFSFLKSWITFDGSSEKKEFILKTIFQIFLIPCESSEIYVKQVDWNQENFLQFYFNARSKSLYFQLENLSIMLLKGIQNFMQLHSIHLDERINNENQEKFFQFFTQFSQFLNQLFTVGRHSIIFVHFIQFFSKIQMDEFGKIKELDDCLSLLNIDELMQSEYGSESLSNSFRSILSRQLTIPFERFYNYYLFFSQLLSSTDLQVKNMKNFHFEKINRHIRQILSTIESHLKIHNNVLVSSNKFIQFFCNYSLLFFTNYLDSSPSTIQLNELSFDFEIFRNQMKYSPSTNKFFPHSEYVKFLNEQSIRIDENDGKDSLIIDENFLKDNLTKIGINYQTLQNPFNSPMYLLSSFRYFVQLNRFQLNHLTENMTTSNLSLSSTTTTTSSSILSEKKLLIHENIMIIVLSKYLIVLKYRKKRKLKLSNRQELTMEQEVNDSIDNLLKDYCSQDDSNNQNFFNCLRKLSLIDFISYSLKHQLFYSIQFIISNNDIIRFHLKENNEIYLQIKLNNFHSTINNNNNNSLFSSPPSSPLNHQNLFMKLFNRSPTLSDENHEKIVNISLFSENGYHSHLLFYFISIHTLGTLLRKMTINLINHLHHRIQIMRQHLFLIDNDDDDGDDSEEKKLITDKNDDYDYANIYSTINWQSVLPNIHIVNDYLYSIEDDVTIKFGEVQPSECIKISSIFTSIYDELNEYNFMANYQSTSETNSERNSNEDNRETKENVYVNDNPTEHKVLTTSIPLFKWIQKFTVTSPNLEFYNESSINRKNNPSNDMEPLKDYELMMENREKMNMIVYDIQLLESMLTYLHPFIIHPFVFLSLLIERFFIPIPTYLQKHFKKKKSILSNEMTDDYPFVFDDEIQRLFLDIFHLLNLSPVDDRCVCSYRMLKNLQQLLKNKHLINYLYRQNDELINFDDYYYNNSKYSDDNLIECLRSLNDYTFGIQSRILLIIKKWLELSFVHLLSIENEKRNDQYAIHISSRLSHVYITNSLLLLLQFLYSTLCSYVSKNSIIRQRLIKILILIKQALMNRKNRNNSIQSNLLHLQRINNQKEKVQNEIFILTQFSPTVQLTMGQLDGEDFDMISDEQSISRKFQIIECSSFDGERKRTINYKIVIPIYLLTGLPILSPTRRIFSCNSSTPIEYSNENENENIWYEVQERYGISLLTMHPIQLVEQLILIHQTLLRNLSTFELVASSVSCFNKTSIRTLDAYSSDNCVDVSSVDNIYDSFFQNNSRRYSSQSQIQQQQRHYRSEQHNFDSNTIFIQVDSITKGISSLKFLNNDIDILMNNNNNYYEESDYSEIKDQTESCNRQILLKDLKEISFKRLIRNESNDLEKGNLIRFFSNNYFNYKSQFIPTEETNHQISCEKELILAYNKYNKKKIAEFSTTITNWCTIELMQTTDPIERSFIIKRLMELYYIAYKMNDFASVVELYNSIWKSQVRKLKWSFLEALFSLSSNVYECLRRTHDIILNLNRQKNKEDYFSLINQLSHSSKTIPYIIHIGFYFTPLTHLFENATFKKFDEWQRNEIHLDYYEEDEKSKEINKIIWNLLYYKEKNRYGIEAPVNIWKFRTIHSYVRQIEKHIDRAQFTHQIDQPIQNFLKNLRSYNRAIYMKKNDSPLNFSYSSTETNEHYESYLSDKSKILEPRSLYDYENLENLTSTEMNRSNRKILKDNLQIYYGEESLCNSIVKYNYKELQKFNNSNYLICKEFIFNRLDEGKKRFDFDLNLLNINFN